MACADSKRLRCSAMPLNTISNLRSSSLLAALPLDDENLLEEILLRLSPKPSSLPRASLVCRRWRNILSDPEFLKRFRKHHRKPPLQGFFKTKHAYRKCNFVSLFDRKSNRIPAERFVVPRSSSTGDYWEFLGCRHGLGVLINSYNREVVVWDPLTGQQHLMPFPPGLCNIKSEVSCWSWHAAVLCVDAEDGHVHGDCFSSPFKVVLLCGGRAKALACIYESVYGAWGNVVSIVTTTKILQISRCVLIGNALYSLISRGDVLAFDIDRHTLDVIEKPTDAYHTGWSYQLWRTKDECGLGLAVLSKLGIHLWEWQMNYAGVFTWVLQPKIIELEGLFPPRMRIDHTRESMVGYDEESNVIVLATYIGDFMLQLQSMRFRRISERNCWDNKMHYPYRNFYTTGGISGHGWLPMTCGSRRFRWD